MRGLALLGVFAVGCGGSVVKGDGGVDAAADSRPADSGGDGGADAGEDSGCPQPPAMPEYACDAAAPGAESCGPWNSTADTPRYPLGCVVTTTMEGTYCGPVTCNCTTELVDGGPSWICPL